MAGLRFTRIKDSGYQEQGTTFQNLTIKKLQYNKVKGILGAEIKTTCYKDDFIIRPQTYNGLKKLDRTIGAEVSVMS